MINVQKHRSSIYTPCKFCGKHDKLSLILLIYFLEIQIYMNVLGIFLKLEDFHHFGKKINTNQSHRAGNGRRPSIYIYYYFPIQNVTQNALEDVK